MKTVNNFNFGKNDVQSPIQQSGQNSVNNLKKFCGFINAPTEAGISDNDDYSVLNETRFFVFDGKDLKKLLSIGLEKENLIYMNIQTDSTSPVSFSKKNVIHKLKLRDPYY